MFDNDEEQDHVQKVKFVGSKDASKKMIELAKKLDPTSMDDEQAKISKGFEDHEGIDAKDKDLLDLILSKLDSKEIDIYTPSSLINHSVYEALAEEQRGQIDFRALNALSTIRRIKDLKDLEGVDETKTYQMELMIHEFRLKKEEIEKNFGDVFII